MARRVRAAKTSDRRKPEGAPVTAAWIVVGLGVLGAVMALVGSWRRRGRHADLGVVSSQWIAEQRLSQDTTRRR